VYIGGNFDLGSLMFWVFVMLAIIVGGIVIAVVAAKTRKEK